MASVPCGGHPIGRRPPSFRRFLEGAAATRSLAGGAAETMAGDADRVVAEVGGQEGGKVAAPAARPRQRQIEHLVEIAVIEETAPIDRDEAAAHDAFEIVVAMRLAQQAQVAVELAFRYQHRAEA